jgi:hypothetical protein
MSEMVRHYYYLSNTKGTPGDRIGPLVEPLPEAFEQVRDRFTAIPGSHREEEAWARTWFDR